MKDAFSIISSNFLRFAAVNGLGGIFVFIGILFIVFLNTFFCYLIMAYSPVNEKVTSIYPALMIIFVISIFIALPFMSIYGLSMDAILHAFILDEKMNEYLDRPA